MAQVSVRINNRDYAIGCDDGEEDKIASLSEFVDRKVTDLVSKLGQVGEARLMLMAAILVAEDLAATYEQNDALRAELSRCREQLTQVEDEAAGLDALARRFEAAAS